MFKEENLYRKFLIERVGYFRNKAKLSARELSLRLGFSGGYIAKFEMGVLNMPSEVLLDTLNILGVTPEKFFCVNPETFDEDKQILEKFQKLSNKSKQIIKDLLNELK